MIQEDDLLYVCTKAWCTGSYPSASDPLAQYQCHLKYPHNRLSTVITGMECPRYQPAVLDCMQAAEVLRLSGSKAFNQMWGFDDDPFEMEL